MHNISKLRYLSRIGMTHARQSSVLSIDRMNPRVKQVEYAVRGPIVQKATTYKLKLAKGENLPFDEVFNANIGDCHAVGQKPITFVRQVLAAAMCPQLIKDKVFPDDVNEKAAKILDACGGRSLGSYTESVGNLYFRECIASYIHKRDGHPSNTDNIVMSSGASEVIKLALFTLTFGEGKDLSGVMIPTPQYPLYSASISEIGAFQINYFLDEPNQWALDIPELERAFNEASTKCTPRALVVINPGNPTGQVLTRENIDNIIEFAAKHSLVLFADEVYQDNIYAANAQFHSFKKCLMESKYKNVVELASFHSMSKGYMGECGIRGGYGEFVNWDPKVLSELKKLKSAQLCSAAAGQAAISILTDPPQHGQPSYDLFMKERQGVLDSLKRKAQKVYETFSKIDGITVNPISGAMYCFPQIHLPQKAIDAAKAKGVAPDAMYVEQLLDETGICLVPGSGFGQRPNTHHFRITILPTEEKIDALLKKFKEFHLRFLATYQ